jgi:hypothetical protein
MMMVVMMMIVVAVMMMMMMMMINVPVPCRHNLVRSYNSYHHR